jgi:hypothetical protein
MWFPNFVRYKMGAMDAAKVLKPQNWGKKLNITKNHFILFSHPTQFHPHMRHMIYRLKKWHRNI